MNKAASALLAGVLCWTAYIATGDAHTVNEQLLHHMGELSQILFFLLGAMPIVELIDAHDGFDLIASLIHVRLARPPYFGPGATRLRRRRAHVESGPHLHMP